MNISCEKGSLSKSFPGLIILPLSITSQGFLGANADHPEIGLEPHLCQKQNMACLEPELWYPGKPQYSNTRLCT